MRKPKKKKNVLFYLQVIINLDLNTNLLFYLWLLNLLRNLYYIQEKKINTSCINRFKNNIFIHSLKMFVALYY